MNYFEWFELPVAFLIDESELRKRFYQKSKSLHPDFHTLADEATQQKVLTDASFNNEAYRVLSDFDRRMQYILQLYGILGEEGQHQLPGEFLMEMMEINETLMELEFDFDEQKHHHLTQTVQSTEKEISEEVAPIFQQFDPQEVNEVSLKKVKEYHLKKRYLLRIKENLSKFAHRQG